MDRITFICGVILQILLVVTFITLFFFTYVAHIEQKIITTQISRLVDDLARDLNIFITPDVRKILQKSVAAATVDASGDASAEASNQAIRKKMTTILIIMNSVGAVALGALMLCFKLNFASIVVPALVSVGIVAAIEFTFVTVFAANYRSLDENDVKRRIISALISYRDSR